MFSLQDIQLIPKISYRESHEEFSPLDLENPFPNNEGSIHLWQGGEDLMVATKLQPYIAKKLPWIHYHELSGASHMFPYADGMSDIIIKSLLK
ncbi:putative alpha/Beta hydrolase [Lupinus albus]|uniref:Putative alpha/Beta hydrolase n=1 Tax=Lupinus albus TaxID=3870 RepID=A0A6A4NFG2_LUPAL|nr:putative alpha/Beta hydrolase [Lupinus albus]